MCERCSWCTQDPAYISYHDREWGRPLHGDRALYELLVLEGMQAGLSWLTVLKKREAFRRAFEGFEPARVAEYGERELERLLSDSGIVRNRRKLISAIGNARAVCAVQRECGSFDAFVWSYAPKECAVPERGCTRATSPEARRLSAALKARGFTFVGDKIMHSFMQAAGLINEHEAGCFLAGRALQGRDE